ncbi:MAG: fatty acid desaturase [Acidimicrobiia bacterium]
MRLVIALLVGFAVTQVAITVTTIYLHRSLAHKALTFHPALQFVFRVILWMSTGMKPRAWAAVHRKHHAHTDTVDDPHSPAISGWVRVQLTNPAMYRRVAVDPETTAKYAKDLQPDKWDKVLFDRAWLGLGLGITLLIVTLGPIYGLIAAVFHMVAYLQLSGAVNAIGHHFGKRPFDNSATNLQWLAFLTAGEGLHNNHHAAPTSATFRLHKAEIDPGWILIRALAFCRLAKVRLDRTVLAKPRSPQPV